MAQITKEIVVDVAKQNIFQAIVAKQHDVNSRFLKVTLCNEGTKIEVPSSATVIINAERANNTSKAFAGTVNSDGTVTVPLTSWMLELDDVVRCSVSIIGADDQKLTSTSFAIYVEAAEYAGTDISEDENFDILLNLIEATNSAAEAAERVNISATQTPTGVDITVTNREGVETTVHVDTLLAVHTWEDVRNAVRLGHGEALFPAGYEFTTHDSDTNRDIIWAVRAHDHHTAANSRLTHTMTLETKYVYSLSSGLYQALQFDQQEALYYAEEGLAAGTYNFTVANQNWYTGDNGKVFQFTLTQPVPAGGQIYAAMTYNQTFAGKNITTYARPSSAAAIETAPITEGSAGTSLGTTDGSGNMNHMHRIAFGSNNYDQSAARQWLNSGAAAGSVWVPTNKFDRPASWAASYTGFMHGLPSDFLAVVQPAVIPCRTNSIYECNSLDGTEFATNQLYNLEDKFFLLSRPEIYGSWDSSSYKDGELLDYYTGLTNTELIKYDAASSARYCWLRSPYPSNAYSKRNVDIDGSLGNHYARNALGVAPACIIA